jgi:hypothetical protein
MFNIDLVDYLGFIVSTSRVLIEKSRVIVITN